jgi:hypothetical protein
MNEERYNETAEQVATHTGLQQSNLLANQNKQMQYQMEEVEKNLADSQLDCETTLNKIYHLLKQDALKLNDEGILDWHPISDAKKRVLTDDGVDKIMQIVQSYINKETLLSNFDDKVIQRRMLDFSLSFSALMFMKYEIFFRTPSMEECQEILKAKIDEKVWKKKMSCDLLGKEFNEVKIRKEILDEFEDRIEYELSKIKQEQTKLNLREFESLFHQIKALVEATHHRAWKGEERGSLRRHFNISEVIGGGQPQQKKGGSWFGFGK